MKIAFFFLITAGLVPGAFNYTGGKTYLKETARVIANVPGAADTVAKKITDTEFLILAYNTGVFEEKASKLAHRTTGNARVKKFATQSCVSQDATNKKLVELLNIKGVAMPVEMPVSLKAELDELNQWMGKEFNDKYLTRCINDQRAAVALFRQVAVSSKDEDILHFAKDAATQSQTVEDSAVSLLKYIDRPLTTTW